MTERKQVTISLYQENIDALKTISEKIKMNPSKIIRYMIDKISVDKKMQEIVSWMDEQEKQKNIGLRIMSNIPTKKEEPSHLSNGSQEPSSDSFSNLPNNSQIDNTEVISEKQKEKIVNLMTERLGMGKELAKELVKQNPEALISALIRHARMTREEILS